MALSQLFSTLSAVLCFSLFYKPGCLAVLFLSFGQWQCLLPDAANLIIMKENEKEETDKTNKHINTQRYTHTFRLPRMFELTSELLNLYKT